MEWTARKRVHRPPAVGVVAFDGGRVLVVDQSRKAVGQSLRQIPGGKIERGESPRVAAERELLEETGYTATAWMFLACVYGEPAYSDELVWGFLAHGLTKVRGYARDERIAVSWVDLESLNLARPVRQDGLSVLFLLLAKQHLGL